MKNLDSLITFNMAHIIYDGINKQMGSLGVFGLHNQLFAPLHRLMVRQIQLFTSRCVDDRHT